LINLLVNIANFATGVIVAAIDGSRRFNTFPDMDGKLIPEGYLQEKPILRDFFENVATAQFHHRLLGYATYFGAVYVFLLSRKLNLPGFVKNVLLALFIVANLQFLDGILMLKTTGYWLVGIFHQSNAIWLLSLSLLALHSISFASNEGFEKEHREQSKNPKNIEKTKEVNLNENINPKQSSNDQDEQVSTEPVGETTKEGDTSILEKKAEKDIDYSNQEAESIENSDPPTEPVAETSKERGSKTFVR